MNKEWLLLSPAATEGGAASGTETGAASAEEQVFDEGQAGGSGQGAGAAAAGATGSGASGEGATAGGASAGVATAGAASSGLSKDDVEAILAGALEKVGGTRQETTQAAPSREWTQADFDKAFNVLRFSPELLAQLRHETPETAMKALDMIRDGIVKQAMTMAEYRMQQLFKDLRDKDLTPINDFVSEQQAVSFRNDFFKSHPDMEPYEKIVDAVAAKLTQSGYEGGSRDEVMQKYYDETKAIVDQLTAAKGNGGANGNANGGQAASTGKNRMSTLTGGGQAGGRSGGGSASPKGPPGIEVFD